MSHQERTVSVQNLSSMETKRKLWEEIQVQIGEKWGSEKYGRELANCNHMPQR